MRLAPPFLAALVFAQAAAGQKPRPPAAPRIAHADTLSGHVLNDEYSWLRDDRRERPEVLQYLQAENAYTDTVMAHTKALRERMYKEMVGHTRETDLSVPERIDSFYYYNRTVKGKQYPIFCRKRGSLTAREEVLLDENAIGEERGYSEVGIRRVSPDGRLLAYTQDTTGSEWFTLYIKDLATGRVMPERMDSVSYGLEWAADNRTLFYTRDDAAHRTDRIYRRTLGDSAETLVYSEPDRLFFLELEKSKDRQYLFARSASFNESEVSYVAAAEPQARWRVFQPRQPNVQYSVKHHGGDFLILTNEGALNFKVLHAPTGSPDASHRSEVAPAQDSTLIEGIDVFADYLVLYQRGNARRQIRVIPFEGGQPYQVTFPEAVYTYEASENPEYRSHLLRFTYSSPLTPPSVYDFDMATRGRKLLKATEVPNFNRSRYETALIWAPTSDGARVPVSLFYRKPLMRDGRRPLLLYSYGAYGASTDAGFSATVLSLVDRGFIFAKAHVRGGQEMGRQWYEDGKMLHKRHTFTDFIAAAEHLVRERYTSSSRMAIRGGSAGGLLIGAVLNMRPDLFRAAVADVPFVDLINTMSDSTLEFTTQEWKQWGDPRIPEQYEYMMTYSPYDNVHAARYPAILATTGLNDPRVNYWEPAKWVARLRATKTDSNPLLLKVNMGAGHGGASGRYDMLRDMAFRFAFIVDAIGEEATP